MKIVFLLQNGWGFRNNKCPIAFEPNELNKSAKTLRKIVGQRRKLLFTNCTAVSTDDAKGNPGRDLDHTNKVIRWCKFERCDLLIVCGSEAKKAYEECEEVFQGTIWFIPHPAARNLTNELLEIIKQHLDNFTKHNHYHFKQFNGRKYEIEKI